MTFTPEQAQKAIKNQQIGLFYIDSELTWRAPLALFLIMRDVFITHGEHIFHLSKFRYHAYSPYFEPCPVPSFGNVPEYKPEIRQLGPNKYHIEWIKLRNEVKIT